MAAAVARWAVVACALFSLVAEPQTVQDLRDARQLRAEQVTRNDQAAMEVQQLQDQAVLDSQRQQQETQVARRQEEYREHVQDEYTADADRGASQHHILGEVTAQETGDFNLQPEEGQPAPPPAPETVARVTTDPHAPNVADPAETHEEESMAQITPAPPVPPGPGGEDYADQVQTHNRNAAIASEAAATFGKSEPLPVTAEQRASDARSMSGPPPPPGPPDASPPDPSPDPDAVTRPDANAAHAWSQATGQENDGMRNDVEGPPQPTDGNVRKTFVDSHGSYSVREPPRPPAPPDARVMELYHNTSVLAHEGGNAAYWHPEDQMPPADNRNPDRGRASPISGVVTTSEPIIENPGQVDEYVAPPIEPEDDSPIESTISVPDNVTASITVEGDEWLHQHVDSLQALAPGNVSESKKEAFQEATQKSIMRFGHDRTRMMKERTDKYIAHAANLIRTKRERVKKGKILEDMRARSHVEREDKGKITAIERSGKKLKVAEDANQAAEITAKERAQKPSAAAQAAIDKAEHDDHVKQTAAEELELVTIHDKERERLAAKEKEMNLAAKERQEKHDKQGNPDSHEEMSLGDILAKDAYMASLRTHGTKAKDLRRMATNLEMDVSKPQIKV